ncbi:hypothetical protein [Brevibacillus borstelensis]|uniref:hypothetical protein n=1 Tax=Brevibacillus borstelensis TaxID=45462 RepID=UPI0030BC0CAF
MQAAVRAQKQYILDCRLPCGTFRLGPERNQVNPYFTNLALIPMIGLGELKIVQEHIDWYLQNRNENGYVNDFVIRGELLEDTGAADSEDSYHATLFSLLAEWVRYAEDIVWLKDREQECLELLEGIGRLQQNDGLTWAKGSYRVKYLMDNCEVAKGLEDAAFLFSLLGNKTACKEAELRAEACRQGIGRMYSPLRKSFAVYGRIFPSWRKWYPDATSQAFPIVYGIASAEIARLLYSRITRSFPQFERFQTGDPYPWMTMGVCALRMGDLARVNRMLATAQAMYVEGPRRPYWLIHEAGRFMELAMEVANIRCQPGQNV